MLNAIEAKERLTRELGNRTGESADISNLGLIYGHFGQM